MKRFRFTQEQLVKIAKLSDRDMAKIKECRGNYNKLGFAYQLCYVKLFNKFPVQEPFDINDEVLTYTAVQTDLPLELITQYQNRRQTISEHQIRIKDYLQLAKFNSHSLQKLEKFLCQQALQIDSTDSLLYEATLFLKEHGILNPAEDRIKRVLQEQRQKVRHAIFEKIYKLLNPEIKDELDKLLAVVDGATSPLNQLKETPKNPSENSIKTLAGKLQTVEATKVLQIDLDWINNNYKRYLSSYARRSDVHKLKELRPARRYASLVCFLQDNYQDTIDYLYDTYSKAITKVNNKADHTVEQYYKAKRKLTRFCLTSHRNICQQLLGVQSGDSDLESLFRKFPEDNLVVQVEEVERLLSGQYSNSLNLVAERFSHLRKLVRPLLENLDYEIEPTGNEQLIEAMDVVRNLISGAKRKVPENIQLDFLPKKIQKLVIEKGVINRKKFEVAVYIAIRDNIKHGNIAIKGSKRFGKFADLFMDDKEWEKIRDDFFKHSRLPQNSQDVEQYLTTRLGKACDYFFEREKDNKFAKAGEICRGQEHFEH